MKLAHGLSATIASLAAVVCLGCGGTDVSSSIDLVDVTFGADRFIAVGSVRGAGDPSAGIDRDDGLIFSSADGVTWSRAMADVGVPLSSVAFGDGRFVAVGGELGAERGVVLNSIDGQAWTRVEVSATLRHVSFGNGRFVATSGNGPLITSTDGVSWSQVEEFEPFLHSTDIAFGNGIFVVAFGEEGVAVSNGWSAWPRADIEPNRHIASLTFSGDAFLAILSPHCIGGCEGATVAARSTNGLTWTQEDTNLAARLLAVAERDGILVGTDGMAMQRSADGVTWSPAGGVESEAWQAIAAGPNRFVAVGRGATAVSDDGATWTETPFELP